MPACDCAVVTPHRPPALFEQEPRKLLNMALSKTSAEPARTAAYSSDIGWRVVWQRAGMGLSFRDIATRLQIGLGTAHRIYMHVQEV